ncbi:hypothetical protein HpHNI55_07990 [Helicobacter pylori]
MSENSIIEIKEREILKEKIIEILKKSKNQNKPVAIAINGEWGIGKTYLWKNGLAPSIRNFINGILSFLSMHFGVKINVNVDFLFKMLKKEHMENTIVCIDEFERLSDKIPVQDILGLISELKEHKGCCVIAIYNDLKLFANEIQNE